MICTYLMSANYSSTWLKNTYAACMWPTKFILCVYTVETQASKLRFITRVWLQSSFPREDASTTCSETSSDYKQL